MTAKTVAQYALLDAAVGLPTMVYPGVNATRHLRHYLNNSGQTYTIDLEDMIRCVPSAKRAMVAEFRQAQRFLQGMPVGRHLFTSSNTESSYNEESENPEWYFAIGGYSYWGKGEATITPSQNGRRYEVDFTYCFRDRYNWDGGKAVVIGGVLVTDKFMGEFHRQGLAREFDCVGSVRRAITWDGDATFPPNNLFSHGKDDRDAGFANAGDGVHPYRMQRFARAGETTDDDREDAGRRRCNPETDWA
ncbi:hypothetical protein [Sphingomonas alpina]|uniref:Uncharacterized protein n=1 Tax=Sphingomonas alpina TaxID=653931 RepID=A0A7H0LPE6_9SPHN|nr:hypothetical protein [Sphingomonas alpina]QNQ11549.1 hypothetical protein H3Z74_10685 [Sphingomonas alpina]